MRPSARRGPEPSARPFPSSTANSPSTATRTSSRSRSSSTWTSGAGPIDDGVSGAVQRISRIPNATRSSAPASERRDATSEPARSARTRSAGVQRARGGADGGGSTEASTLLQGGGATRRVAELARVREAPAAAGVGELASARRLSNQLEPQQVGLVDLLDRV